MEKLDFIDSKFRLAILAAKRGKQLVSGAKKKVNTTADNPLTIAMQEIYQGKIQYKILDEYDVEMDREEAVSLLMGEDDESDSNEVEDFLYNNDDSDEDQEEEEAG